LEESTLSTETDSPDMAGVLRSIYELQNAIYRRMDYRVHSKGGPPATQEQIRNVERAFGCPLPVFHRQFLRIHNGWSYWSGDVTLLSTDQMLTGPYAERIASWKATEHAQGNLFIPDALVVGFSLYVGEQIFIDLASATGEEVIVWERKLNERFPNLLEYFLDHESVLKEQLEHDLA
jgi:cell wall assembly regulator SMI1